MIFTLPPNSHRNQGFLNRGRVAARRLGTGHGGGVEVEKRDYYLGICVPMGVYRDRVAFHFCLL